MMARDGLLEVDCLKISAENWLPNSYCLKLITENWSQEIDYGN